MNSDNKKMAAMSIRNLLRSIEGVGVLRSELEETPERVIDAYEELFCGYSVSIPDLFKTFDGEGSDQIVSMCDIPFTSFCEHHMLPFTGTVNVAYLPKNSRVIGASKMARLVEAYACRLTLQERIAEQVGTAMMKFLQPHGAGVVIKGVHMCMRSRGVKSHSSVMKNSVMLGKFREDPTLRMEVLHLIGNI